MAQDTAILYFTQSENSEKLRKGKRLSSKAIHYLITRSEVVATETGFSVFKKIDRPDHQTSVATRFYLALKEVFDQGFHKVIAIGNDCPQLTACDLIEANKQLDQNDLVIGPDFRGGTYLIGIRKEIFNRKWIESLPWHSKYFSRALQSVTTHLSVLDPLHDVNREREIFSISKAIQRRHLLVPLLKLFSIPPLQRISQWLQEQYVGNYGLRAPPALAI